jgi:hypothetical protein
MLTITCTFTFKDSAKATATLSVVGPEDFNRVEYGGAADRLQKWDKASSCGIKLWARDIAAELGCALNVEEVGEYDTWAE